MERIRELTYPKAYVACFLEDCTNASNWGYYGDSHKGICLKFKTVKNGENESLHLKTITGWGGNGPIHGEPAFTFHKVNYTRTFQAINFFQSLGSVPLGILDKYWYSEELGNSSVYSTILSKNERDNWHKNYWEIHTKCLTSKLLDWKQEHEYRLIIPDLMNSHEKEEDRKLKYRFQELEGIIFGFKTKIEDKIKIMKIINNKCLEAKRIDFKFYQAEYDAANGKMKIVDLNLLKIDLS